jgi:hypothetical protein
MLVFWASASLFVAHAELPFYAGGEEMAEKAFRDSILALGQLRGLLAAFAWANHQCNHCCTFTVEELPISDDIHDALIPHFDEWTNKVGITELSDWQASVSDALHGMLFQFSDLVKPDAVSALTDKRCQREIVDTIMDAFNAGLQPLQVWRVEIEPRGFYECVCDDFAIRGNSGRFLLHLGVSD